MAICDNDPDINEHEHLTSTLKNNEPNINLINLDKKEEEKHIKNNDNLKRAKNHESLTFNDNGGLLLDVDLNKGLFNLFNP